MCYLVDHILRTEMNYSEPLLSSRMRFCLVSKANHYNPELEGVTLNAKLLILGWVGGIRTLGHWNHTMQTRMHSVCIQASKTYLSGPGD